MSYCSEGTHTCHQHSCLGWLALFQQLEQAAQGEWAKHHGDLAGPRRVLALVLGSRAWEGEGIAESGPDPFPQLECHVAHSTWAPGLTGVCSRGPLLSTSMELGSMMSSLADMMRVKAE
jgi:hypothetical protein